LRQRRFVEVGTGTLWTLGLGLSGTGNGENYDDQKDCGD
jgi:hypothetical protein